ncbi:MAG: dienelactone hydrolase family protein [Rhodospirillaceae bacterium]|jgi:dienelactone hydrolase|nr:dienelactone hydrolase family protein [Rhodospirillaceae bacterium]MBT5666289.1 dienelactone hydrolase family protein [Rhodospirillaceae bacterium]MBT5810252.1 dienelactone hydrolase family protein [Rhodospirillaceae bacterium]
MFNGFKGLAYVLAFALLGSWATGDARADIKTKAITYTDGDVTLQGTMAWDAAKTGKRPGILIVHEWWGLDDYARGRAKKLAAEGYVAFALDMYGVGKVTDHPKEAGKWAKQINSNIANWTRRAQAGLAVLKADPNVAAGKTAAIGYCFGGSTVMQMAYANQDVRAVASFHGSLPSAADTVTSVKPRIFAAHGRDDTFINADRITAFKAGLDRTKADWEMTVYSGTKHSFTNPGADSRGINGLAYNPRADKRSWAAMLTMFDEVFK